MLIASSHTYFVRDVFGKYIFLIRNTAHDRCKTRRELYETLMQKENVVWVDTMKVREYTAILDPIYHLHLQQP
jgi:hypothetical protein